VIKKLFKNFKNQFIGFNQVKEGELKLMLGKQLCFLQKNVTAKTLADIEFKVFSQWGEDGIIEYLADKLPIENDFFIEFGVENYNESNTRFLMMNRNWSGLIMDSSPKNISYIKNREYFWKYDLHPIATFINKENINDIISNKIKKLGISNKIGLLSVDIDGVDYWILSAIDCIDPTIIICEYNAIFPDDIPLTVPYDKSFIRNEKHHSNLYWGANLKAFINLLEERDYKYLGSNLQNSNAFFCKKKLAEKYLSSLFKGTQSVGNLKIRESKDAEGNFTLLRGRERINEIKNLPLINLTTQQKIKIENLL
jgi:hypothetical protein